MGDTEVTLLAPLNPVAGGPGAGHRRSVLRVVERPFKKQTIERAEIQRGGRLSAAANSFDVDVPWIMPVALQYGTLRGGRESGPDSSHPSSIVLGTVFGQVNYVNYAQGVLAGFFVVAAVLLLVELVSFILGFSMTRTITGAVHNLYEARSA